MGAVIGLIGPVGTTELLIVLAIVLVIWGGRKLPELGTALGSGFRNFKDSVTGNDSDEEPERPEIEATSVEATATPVDEPAAPASEPKT